jgi:transcriptional regulator with XRE-family HTH domain
MARPFDGSALRQVREGLGVQLLELAKATGIPYQELQAIEKGDIQPTGTQAIDLADWLTVNPDKLYAAGPDDSYRGNKGKVGQPITGNDFAQHHAQNAKQRELQGLLRWLQTTPLPEIRRDKQSYDRARELERELKGHTAVTDAYGEVFDKNAPSYHTTVEDLRREQAEQQRQQLAEAGGAVPQHSWRVE